MFYQINMYFLFHTYFCICIYMLKFFPCSNTDDDDMKSLKHEVKFLLLIFLLEIFNILLLQLIYLFMWRNHH